MKLRNKKTGDIVETGDNFLHLRRKYLYSSLAELNEEWEDYKSDKERWYINENGGVLKYIPVDPNGEDLTYMGYQKEIGNYFETKEEAEKAVEKLKAFKRLKDKGFRFNGWNGTQIGSNIAYISEIYYEGCADDMDLLFGGEE